MRWKFSSWNSQTLPSFWPGMVGMIASFIVWFCFPGTRVVDFSHQPTGLEEASKKQSCSNATLLQRSQYLSPYSDNLTAATASRTLCTTDTYLPSLCLTNFNISLSLPPTTARPLIQSTTTGLWKALPSSASFLNASDCDAAPATNSLGLPEPPTYSKMFLSWSAVGGDSVISSSKGSRRECWDWAL